MAEIYIFGDSITQGAFDERGGWADRLKQHFYTVKLQDLTKPSIGVFNLGVSGNTADDISKRVEQEIIVRRERRPSFNDVFIVAVGVNDSRSNGSADNLVSSPEHYLEKLEAILDIVKRFGNKILFIGLTPVDDVKTLAREDSQYWLTRVSEFNDVLVSFCKMHNFPLVEIFNSMQKLNYKKLLPDGLHPNSEGHAWMYEQIRPHVIKLLEEK